MSEQVDILLATYQGENYLEEQLESILTQTHPYLHLWIRDDGSSDQTQAILKKWLKTYPQKISLLSTHHHLGIKGNFSELMKHSQAPYIMFADQDDQWLPHKVEASLDQLKALERQYGSHLPLLVHTDLKVVNCHLEEMASSFWHYAGLNPEHSSSLNRLLAQNVLTGCTMFMNRSLIDLAYPIPEEALMHDWWVALVACSFGHIQFLNQATLLYRQHNRNDTGAHQYKVWDFLLEISKGRHRKSRGTTNQTYKQAHCFLERYKSRLPHNKQALFKAYEELEDLSYFKKKRQVIKYQFFKQGFLRNAKSLFFL